MKKIIPFIVGIAIFALIVSSILYHLIHKSRHPTKRDDVPTQVVPSVPKPSKKITRSSDKSSVIIPPVTEKSSGEPTDKPKPVNWSELSRQLLQLEQQRQHSANLLIEKARQD